MKFVAIVPARAGSKRAKGKNTRLLGGKRLVDWTVDFASKLDWIDEIYVSTDIEPLLNSFENTRVICDSLRPRNLSEDQSTTEDVVIHVLEKYRKRQINVENILLLQPTSPFRTISRIENGKVLFEKYPLDRVVGVSEHKKKLSWLYTRGENYLTKVFESDFDKTNFFHLDGSFYFINAARFLAERRFVNGNLRGILPNHPFETCDIDTEEDFLMAEAYSKLWSGDTLR